MSFDKTGLRSRRTLLAGAFGGIAALAANALVRPASVTAHDPDDVRLGGSNASTAPTRITNSNTANGAAIIAIAAGTHDGVSGTTSQGNGVMGQSTGVAGKGVHGISTSEEGAGVLGESDSGYGVYGQSSTGIATYGYSTFNMGLAGGSSSDRLPAVFGANNGDNTGVQGFSGHTSFPQASPPKTGVFGSADQDGRSVGVRGASPTGRGGSFSGKRAPLRLLPSADATHPIKGAKGDLFVDTSGRLWFCKGGTGWVQLA